MSISNPEKFDYLKVAAYDPTNTKNHYMNVWRVTNNIDAQRDIFISGEQIGIDATAKNALDGYHRQWPQMTNCTRSVIDGLIKKGLLDNNSEFFEKFEIFG